MSSRDNWIGLGDGTAYDTKQECFFCKHKGIVRFRESHMYFCPDCSAIYTYMIKQETNCNHLEEGKSPVVIRLPWYKKDRENAKPYVVEGEDDTQTCSVCNAECIFDGF